MAAHKTMARKRQRNGVILFKVDKKVYPQKPACMAMPFPGFIPEGEQSSKNVPDTNP
jgi:hypothetical protein